MIISIDRVIQQRATYYNHDQLDTLYEQNKTQDPPLITVNMKVLLFMNSMLFFRIMKMLL